MTIPYLGGERLWGLTGTGLGPASFPVPCEKGVWAANVNAVLPEQTYLSRAYLLPKCVEEHIISKNYQKSRITPYLVQR